MLGFPVGTRVQQLSSRERKMSTYPFVEGEPPSFYLDQRDEKWKDKIRSACQDTLQHPCLRFTVTAWQRGSNYFDLDNISKLVLDVVGKEAMTVWVSVELGESPGVAISDEVPPSPSELCEESIYLANPPTQSVRSSIPLPELENCKIIGSDEPLGLVATFDSHEARIGAFGFEGPIKPLIDRFGPLLGTYHQGAADYRIHEIRIFKGHQPEKSGVTVGLWFLTPTEKERYGERS
jgi:hypothetical protein